VELGQEVELADTCEGDERRGVADNSHRRHKRSRALRVARSSS
jgi:hypothetical protein